MSDQIYEITGTVHRVDESPTEFSKFFTKQSFVLLNQSTFKDKIFEDFIEFDCINDMTSALVGVRAGNKIKVSFVIQGKESKNEKFVGRFFNTLKVIKIEVLEATNIAQRAEAQQQGVQQEAVNDFVGAGPAPNLKHHPDDLSF